MPSSLRRFLLVVLFLLVITNAYLIYLDFKTSNKGLTLAMLDVGQGDALYIESPTGTKVLVDSGSEKKILSSLSKVMSPFDRRFDAIIMTNPDADHIGGFLDILDKYKVDASFHPGTVNDSRTFERLEAKLESKKIPEILARRGMKLNLGGGAVIEILFPDRNVIDWTSNDGSIVAKLTYGKTSVMLTGDSTKETEKIVLSGPYKENLQSAVLKVGHHGSHTSTSTDFASVVRPSYALISLGKDNKYGHPHAETLETLNSLGVKIFRTDLLGTIVMKSDGEKEVFSYMK